MRNPKSDCYEYVARRKGYDRVINIGRAQVWNRGVGELALAGKLGEMIEQSFNQLYIGSTIKV